MADGDRGVYRKYDVKRTDGSSGPGGKHELCPYLVLDLVHDKHAIAALRAYAESCRAEFPELANDLDEICAADALRPAHSPALTLHTKMLLAEGEGDG